MHCNLVSGKKLCLVFFAVFALYNTVYAVGALESLDLKLSTCCPATSPGPVPGRILHCAYVEPSPGCNEAYVLTMNHTKYCVEVGSPWMNIVLQRLNRQGRPCEGILFERK